MQWRNLYLTPDNILLTLAKRLGIKILVDSNENQLWVKSTKENYFRILETYYKKKGIVFHDH